MNKDNKKPMTKEDAARIQSNVDKKKPIKESDEAFKERVQKAGDKNSKKK